MERTQQRVRGPSEQLETANATIKNCTDKNTTGTHNQDKKQAPSPGRRSESFSLLAVGKSLWTDGEENKRKDNIKILWIILNQRKSLFSPLEVAPKRLQLSQKTTPYILMYYCSCSASNCTAKVVSSIVERYIALLDEKCFVN